MPRLSKQKEFGNWLETTKWFVVTQESVSLLTNGNNIQEVVEYLQGLYPSITAMQVSEVTRIEYRPECVTPGRKKMRIEGIGEMDRNTYQNLRKLMDLRYYVGEVKEIVIASWTYNRLLPHLREIMGNDYRLTHNGRKKMKITRITGEPTLGDAPLYAADREQPEPVRAPSDVRTDYSNITESDKEAALSLGWDLGL